MRSRERDFFCDFFFFFSLSSSIEPLSSPIYQPPYLHALPTPMNYLRRMTNSSSKSSSSSYMETSAESSDCGANTTSYIRCAHHGMTT